MKRDGRHAATIMCLKMDSSLSNSKSGKIVPKSFGSEWCNGVISVKSATVIKDVAIGT